MEIVPMAPRHLEELAKLEAICFSRPWTAAGLGAELQNPAAHFLVAQEEGRILGYVGLHFVLDEGDVANVAVFPQHRGRGAAKALLAAQAAWAKGRGLCVLHLEVRPSNLAALGLYRGLGFQETGRRRNFYDDPREDALLLSLELG